MGRHNWLLAAWIGLMAALPLWQPGFLNTRIVGESPYLLMRTHQLAAGLTDGVFPVRWMPDGAYGLGYPFFNFYAALPFYLAAGLKLLGITTSFSLQIVQTTGFILGAVGVYAWTHHHLKNTAAALLAAAVFTFAPMHMINVYVRGDSLSEFWAMGLYPWVLWAVDSVIQHPDRRRAAGLGTAFAALILSHNVSALIFAPLAGVYALWMIISSDLTPRPPLHDMERGSHAAIKPLSNLERGWGEVPFWQSALPRITMIGVGFALGLALSAWFWLPALMERDTVQTEVMLGGFFDWRENFLAGRLIQPGGIKNFPPGLSWLQAGLAAVGTAGLIVTDQRRWGLWALMAFLFALFMTQPASTPIYETVPLVDFVQFTWRWLSVAAVAGAGVAAFSVMLVPSRLRGYTTLVAILVLAGTSLADLNLDFIAVSEDNINAARLSEMEYYSGDIGTTVRAEYLPAGVERPLTGPGLLAERSLRVLDGQASGTLESRSANAETWLIRGNGATVAVPTLWWPGWTAHLDDGTRLDLSSGAQGWIQFTLPAGDHRVNIALGETPLRRAVNWFSLLVGVTMVVVCVHESLARTPSPVWKGGWGVRLIAIPAVVLVFLRLIQPSASGPTATQFLHSSYRHAYPNGIVFPDGVRLLDYDYPAEIRAGEYLTVALSWSQPVQARIEVVPAAVNLGQPESILDGANGQDVIHLEHVYTPGLYFVRVIHAETVYDLAPVRVLPAPERPPQQVIRQIADQLQLLDVTTHWHDTDRLNVYLHWIALDVMVGRVLVTAALYNTDGVLLAQANCEMDGLSLPDQFTGWLTLTGLAGLPPGDGYRLRVGVISEGRLIGGADIADVVIRSSPPSQLTGLALDLPQPIIEQGDHLPVTLRWRGEDQPAWRLPSGAVVPVDLPSVRTDWLQSDQVYTTHHYLPLDLPPGDYTLSVGDVSAAFTISASERQFAPEDIEPVVVFGPLALLDYVIEDNTLRMSWTARERPATDLSLFVHHLNPADGFVVSQTDLQLPVAGWFKDEQVDIAIPLPAGDYDIAIGWYDPLTFDRLPSGLPDDRLLLTKTDRDSPGT